MKVSNLVGVSVSQFKKGNIVHMHGGTFEVTEDAYVVDHSFNSKDYGPVCGTHGICLSGEIEGYFSPGSTWWFQGNDLSRFLVEF